MRLARRLGNSAGSTGCRKRRCTTGRPSSAGWMLAASALRELLGTAVKREAVAHLRTMFQMSERRACSVIAADRTSIRYQFCRPPDTELRCRLRDLANARRRVGYRRLFVLLHQQGEPSGINRIYRLYRA